MDVGADLLNALSIYHSTNTFNSSTCLVGEDDGVEAGGHERPAATENPVLGIDGRSEQSERQELGVRGEGHGH